MKIGFTGTQNGMSGLQYEAVRKLLESLEWNAERRRSTEFHHGDCIGADVEAARVSAVLGMRLIVHPPLNEAKRAFHRSDNCEVRKPKPYLDRNRDIVNECELLIAAPSSVDEQLRSGTWSTVRYARKCEKPTIIIDPYGVKH